MSELQDLIAVRDAYALAVKQLQAIEPNVQKLPMTHRAVLLGEYARLVGFAAGLENEVKALLAKEGMH